MFHNQKNIIVSLITTSLDEKIKSLIIFFSLKKNASAHNLAEEYYQEIYDFITKKTWERFPKRLVEEVD